MVIAAAAAALAAASAILLLVPPRLPAWTLLGGRSAPSRDALRQLAATTGQVNGGAFLAGVAVAFLGAQLVGPQGASRRLRKLLAAPFIWTIGLAVPALMCIASGAAAVGSWNGADATRAPAIGLLLSSAASFAAVAALLFEQRAMTDPYRLAHRLARVVTVRSVQRFGFVADVGTPGYDATGQIVRYNLDYRTPDPLGPISEVFWQSVRERDRVLLQVVSDEIAARPLAAAGVPYQALPLSELIALGTAPTRRPRRVRVAARWRAARALGPLLFCNHYLVRHGSNAVREFGLEQARDPFVLSVERQIVSFAARRDLEVCLDLAVRALEAIVLSSRPDLPVPGQRATAGLAGLAEHLANRGWRRQAVQVAQLAGWVQGRGGHAAALQGQLGRVVALSSILARSNPSWVPSATPSSLWHDMLPELAERSKRN